MKKLDMVQTVSIVANLGVIGGLIFVGFQLRQDRELATIDSIQSISSARMSSSQLITENADLWVRGLADEPLTDAETAIFDALAEARHNYYFTNNFRNIRIGSADNAERWVREAALDIFSNPGLKKWWQRQLDRQAAVDPDPNGSDWQAAVNTALARYEQLSER